MENKITIGQLATELGDMLLFPVPPGITYDELVDWLSPHINLLLKNDFNRLIYLLYRVDISEEKLRYLLANNKDAMVESIIAKMMIERQSEKIESRRRYRNNGPIADDEKW